MNSSSPAAARAISERLPEAVAVAVIDLITGPLLADPHRLGLQLKRELKGHPVGKARNLQDSLSY